MTDEELRQLAVDVEDGKVFGSWMIPEEHLDVQLPIVFLPFYWGAAEKIKDQDVSVIYEYVDRTKRKTPNGYPVFTSFRTLTKEECDKLGKLITRLRQIKQAFLALEIKEDNNDENQRQSRQPDEVVREAVHRD